MASQQLRDRIEELQDVVTHLMCLAAAPPDIPEGMTVACVTEVDPTEGNNRHRLPNQWSYVVVPNTFPKTVRVVGRRLGENVVQDTRWIINSSGATPEEAIEAHEKVPNEWMPKWQE